MIPMTQEGENCITSASNGNCLKQSDIGQTLWSETPVHISTLICFPHSGWRASEKERVSSRVLFRSSLPTGHLPRVLFHISHTPSLC